MEILPNYIGIYKKPWNKDPVIKQPVQWNVTMVFITGKKLPYMDPMGYKDPYEPTRIGAISLRIALFVGLLEIFGVIATSEGEGRGSLRIRGSERNPKWVSEEQWGGIYIPYIFIYIYPPGN